MKERFGEWIKMLRISKKMTLKELAPELGYHFGNLSKIEKCQREFNEEKLTQLASVFNLDIEIVKAEFISDFIARRILQERNYQEILELINEKVQYFEQNRVNFRSVKKLSRKWKILD